MDFRAKFYELPEQPSYLKLCMLSPCLVPSNPLPADKILDWFKIEKNCR